MPIGAAAHACPPPTHRGVIRLRHTDSDPTAHLGANAHTHAARDGDTQPHTRYAIAYANHESDSNSDAPTDANVDAGAYAHL